MTPIVDLIPGFICFPGEFGKSLADLNCHYVEIVASSFPRRGRKMEDRGQLFSSQPGGLCCKLGQIWLVQKLQLIFCLEFEYLSRSLIYLYEVQNKRQKLVLNYIDCQCKSLIRNNQTGLLASFKLSYVRQYSLITYCLCTVHQIEY